MLSRQITAVGTAALLLATSAAAQTPRWEFGTFGNYTAFGDLVQLEDKFGAGGRLGFFLWSRFELEAAGSVTGTQPTGLAGDVTYRPIRARLLYNQPMFGGLALLLGAGYVRNQYSAAGTSSSDNGFGGLFGMRLNLGRRFALRVDGTMDYMSEVSGAATPSSERNLGLEAGLSLLLGGSRSSHDDWADLAEDFGKEPPELAAADAEAEEVPHDASPPSTSTGPRRPRWEFGTFGNYTAFGDLVQLEDKFGGGGRLGFFLWRRFELEAASSVTGTQVTGLAGDVTYRPIRARLLYNQPMFGGLALLLGAGYVRNQYDAAGTSSSDNGMGGLLGMRLNLGQRFALRVDGTMDYMSEVSGAATPSSERNLGLEAGLSLLLGGSRSSDDWGDVADVKALPELAAADTDADGVLDDLDRCPATPAGVTVDEVGCAAPMAMDVHVETDGDGDGIVDTDDLCLDSPIGAPVGPTGCPVLSKEDAERMAQQGVIFVSGKWEITPEARVTLDDVAQALHAYPSMRLEISGYTDNIGPKRKNLYLSWTRAEAVKLYLTRKGVARDRLVTRGFGSDDPVADNDTAEGRALNRRARLRKLN